MILTLIFIQYGVNLEGEIKKKLLHTDIYNDRSLKRMGFVKVGERWIHKGEERPEVSREAAPSSPSFVPHEEHPPPPPPQEVRSEFGASSSSTQTVRLDQDQLKEVIDHVMSGMLASGYGSNQSTSPVVEASLDRLIHMISQQQERMESFEEQMRALRIDVDNSTRATETGGQEKLHALQQLTIEVRHVGSTIGASLTVLTTLVTRLISEFRSDQRTPPGPPPSSSQPPPPPGPSPSSSYPRITELD